MKKLRINKIEKFDNRIVVGVNLTGTAYPQSNDYAELSNAFHSICKKHNAQETVYQKPKTFFDMSCQQNSGGAIIFHSHSCNPELALLDLIKLSNENKD